MFRHLTFFAEGENLEKLKACPTTLTLDVGVVVPYTKPKTSLELHFGHTLNLFARISSNFKASQFPKQ